MNAYFFFACTSLDASGSLSDVLALGMQPTAFAHIVSALLTAVLVVVTMLSLMERVLRRRRRSRKALCVRHMPPGLAQDAQRVLLGR